MENFTKGDWLGHSETSVEESDVCLARFLITATLLPEEVIAYLCTIMKNLTFVALGFTVMCVYIIGAQCSLGRVVMDEDWSASDNWFMKSKSNPEVRIPLFLALKQRNLDVLNRVLERVSDPRSSDYGKQ